MIGRRVKGEEKNFFSFLKGRKDFTENKFKKRRGCTKKKNTGGKQSEKGFK